MLGVAMACGWFLEVFYTVHLLSISDRKLVIFGGVGSGNSGTLFPEILARSAAAGHISSNFR
jgi:hypothetical protein